ncbi:MAG: CAF17-like 4Fe-4S cluster assembly/insertion protein YgfZ [Microthrixaceae bacterium]
MSDVTADHLALRREVAAVRVPRDVIRAFGVDAVTFLQGQISQDIADLAPGASTWALILEPQGKVDAWVRIWGRRVDDEVLMDVDGGAGHAVLERLNRFRLRVKVELELLDWECVALRGPATPPLDDPSLVAELKGTVDWAGTTGVDLLGPEVRIPAGIELASFDAYESARIEAGWPAMGHELGAGVVPQVIPAEAGQWLVDASVSFTKGCYTGQELVARVDSRGGNTPRHLRGLVMGTNVLPPVGAEIVVGEDVRGTLTSVGESIDLRAPIALAYVHRSVEPGTEVVVRWPEQDDAPAGEVAAQVRLLPLTAGRA